MLKKWMSILVILLVITAFSSCDLFEDDDTSDNFTRLFSAAVEEVAPHFEESRMGFNTADTNWSAGNAVYEMYGILNIEGDTYGYFNVHDQVETADRTFSDAAGENGTEFSGTAGTLAAPFQVSLPDSTMPAYDRKHTSDNVQILIADETSSKAMTYVSYSKNTDNDSINVESVKGVYNEDNGDIELISMKLNDVTYETSSVDRLEFCKVYLKGNTETNTFFMKLELHDVNSDGSSNWDRGKLMGYGKSEGADNYFLFRVEKDGSSRYIKFEADSDKADLQALVEAATTNLGYTEAEVTSTVDPEGYLTQIKDIVTSTDTFFTLEDIANTAANYDAYHAWTADDILTLF